MGATTGAEPEASVEAGGRPDVSATTGRLLLVAASLAGLWLVRHGLVAAVPAGVDVDGHVARTDWAFHLWRHGRIDGWFPAFGSGYRLFAVYGPGLQLAAGLVRLLSLGHLSTSRCLAVVGATSMVLLPWAVAALSRALGSTRLAAALHGTLALAASVPFGGGLAGLYAIGLVPQALALPVQVAAMAAILRLGAEGTVRRAAQVALLLGALVLLHPISVLILAVITPPLLLLRARSLTPRRLGLLAGSGLWALAVAAVWVLPALGTFGQRGGVSAWATPPLPSRLGAIWRGEILFPRPITWVLLLGLAVTLGEAIRRPEARRRLVPVAVALAYLVVAHWMVGHHVGPTELRIQFANRGLALMGILALGPVAGALADLVLRPRLPGPIPVRGAVLVGLAVVAVPALLRGPLDPRQRALPAGPDLRATAGALHRLVPEGARHVLAAPSPYVYLGSDQAARYLVVRSGTSSAHLYFAEATRSGAAGVLADHLLVTTTPEDAIGELRRLGVTEVVTTTPQPADQLAIAGGYHLVHRTATLATYRVEAEPGAPSVGALLQPDEQGIRPVGQVVRAHVLARGPERYRWTATATMATPVVVAVADDPAWEVRVDGRVVHTRRSVDELVGFDLPAGRHRVELRYTADRNPWFALMVSLVATAAAVVAALGVSRPGRAGRRAGRPPARRSGPSTPRA